MDWSFTEEQDELAALTRQILERELTEERMRAIEATDDRFDEKLFATLRDTGILDAVIDGGVIELCRVLQEIGRAVAPVPILPAMVAARAVTTFGGSLDRRKILGPALVEELNPDPAQPVTRADDGKVFGTKVTVPAGTIAEAFLVPAITDEGVRVFVVQRGESGVSVVRQKVTDTSAEAIVEFDGAPGTELGGVEVVEWLVRHYTVGLSAMQLGVCERALELTAEYSKTRVQFERPIATFQAVGQRLADAYIDVNAIRLVTWQAAWRLSEGLDCDADIATAKFWAADAGHRVAHTAVHVHGGMGIDLDYHLNRYFVAAKRIEFALGGATEQLVALGRYLANEPA